MSGSAAPLVPSTSSSISSTARAAATTAAPTAAGGRIADDLAAEVFTRAFAQRERYDLTRDSAGPWLYGIATNLAGTYWRQERSRYRALARSHQDGVAPSDEDLITDRMSAVAAGP